MSNATVSVIIPVHNGDAFIAESIRSVLHQTYAVHECIVVDDGSTDGTADAAAGFGADVRLIRQRRRGVAAARNAGIAATSGTHVAFLDADDVWMPEKIARQLEALSIARTAAGAVCGYVVADESLKPLRAVVHRSARRALEKALIVEAAGLGFSFTGMATRAAVERSGGFDERLSVSADLDFAWRLSGHGGLTSVPSVLALHRRHSFPQLHRDVARLVHDMQLVLRTVEAGGLPARAVRRGRANLRVYSDVRRLRQRRGVSDAARLLTSTGRHPAVPFRMATRLAIQRARQRRELGAAAVGHELGTALTEELLPTTTRVAAGLQAP